MDLFGQEVREGIEAGIFGSQAGGFGGGMQGYGFPPQPVQQLYGQGGGLPPNHFGATPAQVPAPLPEQLQFEADKAKAMRSLTMALQTKRGVLERNPGNTEVRVHVGVLEQVSISPST